MKVCDFACGSAAFLVAAARYLSARLLEAWAVAQQQHGANVSITPYGDSSLGGPDEELIPRDAGERELYALRIVVERCLYGVDLNPLAVEMAKLSLWLLTLQRNRPFTFLDHAIRCGDSLLGVDLKQLSTWSLSGEGAQSVLFQDDLSFAADKREGLMKMQYRPGDQQRLLDAALAKTRRLRAAVICSSQRRSSRTLTRSRAQFRWASITKKRRRKEYWGGDVRFIGQWSSPRFSFTVEDSMRS